MWGPQEVSQGSLLACVLRFSLWPFSGSGWCPGLRCLVPTLPGAGRLGVLPRLFSGGKPVVSPVSGAGAALKRLAVELTVSLM